MKLKVCQRLSWYWNGSPSRYYNWSIAVVSAGSVVVRDVESGVVIKGVPAR